MMKSASQAVKFLRSVSKAVPEAAFVLGSGVSVLEGLADEQTFAYGEVFGLAPTVLGHAGSITLGQVEGHLVAVMRGRFHLYEGHDWDTVTLPARAMVEWGVRDFYLTNAAGGLNPQFVVGDLMLITSYRDHLNPKWKEKGLIPALMAPAVDCQNELSAHVWNCGHELSGDDKQFCPLRKGTYAGLLGPTYETLAEIEMLRRLGADAVGMSTVPEIQTAAGTKTQTAAISVVTNVWSDEAPIEGHEEVLQAAKAASRRLDKLFRACIASRV